MHFLHPHNLLLLIQKHKNFFIYTFLLFCIIFLEYYCSKSTPKFNYNSNPSANIFLTIGGGIFEGSVPYRDLFDAKGFLIFFLGGLADLINPSGYIGLFIFSCLSLSLASFLFYKVIKFFLNTQSALISTFLFLYLILKNDAIILTGGGVSDEFTLPFIMSIFYLFTKDFFQNKVSHPHLYLQGLFVGILIFCKFNLIIAGFPIFLWYTYNLYKNRKLHNLIYYILGILSISIPIFFYFYKNNAVNDLLDNYFLFNTLYVNSAPKNHLNSFYTAFIRYIVFFVPYVISFIYLIKVSFKKNVRMKNYFSIFFVTLVFMFFMIYASANHPYYFISFTPFLLFPSLCFFKIFNKSQFHKTQNICIIIFFIIIMFDIRQTSRAFIKTDEIYAELDSNKSISTFFSQCPNTPKILHFGLMDTGIYKLIKARPKEKYYQNINYDDVGLAKQKELIKNHKYDYVVIRFNSEENAAYLKQNGYKKIKLPKYQQELYYLPKH